MFAPGQVGWRAYVISAVLKRMQDVMVDAVGVEMMMSITMCHIITIIFSIVNQVIHPL